MDSILETLRSHQEKSYPRTWNLAVHLTSQIIHQRIQRNDLQEAFEKLTTSFEDAKTNAQNRMLVDRYTNLNKKIQEKTQTLEKLRQEKQEILNRIESFDDDVAQIKRNIQEFEDKKRTLQESNQKIKDSIDEVDGEKLTLSKTNSGILIQNKYEENQKLDKRIQQSEEYIKTLKQINKYNTLSTKPPEKSVTLNEQEESTNNTSSPKPKHVKIAMEKDSKERRKSITPVSTKSHTSQSIFRRRKSTSQSTTALPTPIPEPSKFGSSEADREAARMPKKSTSPTSAIAFSKSGSLIATGDGNGVVSLYVGFDNLLCTATVQRTVTSIDFNTDDSRLLVAGFDNIYVMEITYTKNNDTILATKAIQRLHKKAIQAIFVHTNQFVVCEEQHIMTLYEINKRGTCITQRHQFKHKHSSTACCVYQGESGSLVAGYRDGTIRIWNIDSSMAHEFPYVHNSDQLIVQVLYYENLIISLSTDKKIVIIDPTSQNAKQKIPITQCEVSDRSRIVAKNGKIYLGTSDGIYIYSIARHKFEKKMENTDKQDIFVLTANRDMLVSGDKNGRIKQWE